MAKKKEVLVNMMASKPTYTLKEKYNYHKSLADNGVDSDGTILSFSQKAYHANRAYEILKKQNAFMQGVEFGEKIAKK